MQTKTIQPSKNSHYVSYAEGVNTSGDGDETALIVNEQYFILNGDWIDRYKQCKNKKEQKKLFLDECEENIGFWSDDPKILTK